MYVKPYIKRGKSDAVDAAAICEAVTRPTMRFVAIKSEEQQGVLFLHRAHDLIVRQRTQLSNMLRGLLSEFGIVIAHGIGSAIKFAKGVLQGNKPGIPEVAIDVLSNLSNQLVSLHLRVRWYEMRMHIQARQDPRVMLLRAIPGVGPVTASAAMPFVQPCAGLVVDAAVRDIGALTSQASRSFSDVHVDARQLEIGHGSDDGSRQGGVFNAPFGITDNRGRADGASNDLGLRSARSRPAQSEEVDDGAAALPNLR